MFIKFESPLINRRSFTDRNNRTWHVATQSGLCFKEGSKYPDKYEHTLAFTNNEQEAMSVSAFQLNTEYELSEDSYYVDRNNNLAFSPRLKKRESQVKAA